MSEIETHGDGDLSFRQSSISSSHHDDDAVTTTTAASLLLFIQNPSMPPSDDGVNVEQRSAQKREYDITDELAQRNAKRRQRRLPLHHPTTLGRSAAVVVNPGATTTKPPIKSDDAKKFSTKTMDGKRGNAGASLHREGAQASLPENEPSVIMTNANRNGPTQVSLEEIDREDEERKRFSASPFEQASGDQEGATIIPQDDDQQLSELTANPQAVYFGWIRHVGTRIWREVVKSFSQNRMEYPSWSDEIGQKVLTVLREDKGIDEFFISRRRESNSESKKLFDKQKRKVGMWSPATPQEIIDRTKQRFIDDRKPQAVLDTGVKRPRGRPPKPISRDVSLDIGLDSNSTWIAEMSKTFHQWRLMVESNKMNGTALTAGDEDPMSKPVARNPKELIALMQDFEKLQIELRKRFGTDVANATKNEALAIMPLVLSSDKSDDVDDDAKPQPLKSSCADGTPPNDNDNLVTSNSSIVVPERRPWFPVTPENVCFQWNSHEGTVMWRGAVKVFSDDSTRYPEWTDQIADGVKQKLAEEDCVVFLEFLDRRGNPCDSIHEGLWYLATDEEVVKKTKEQFVADRQQQLSKRE